MIIISYPTAKHCVLQYIRSYFTFNNATPIERVPVYVFLELKLKSFWRHFDRSLRQCKNSLACS